MFLITKTALKVIVFDRASNMDPWSTSHLRFGSIMFIKLVHRALVACGVCDQIPRRLRVSDSSSTFIEFLKPTMVLLNLWYQKLNDLEKHARLQCTVRAVGRSDKAAGFAVRY